MCEQHACIHLLPTGRRAECIKWGGGGGGEDDVVVTGGLAVPVLLGGRLLRVPRRELVNGRLSPPHARSQQQPRGLAVAGRETGDLPERKTGKKNNISEQQSVKSDEKRLKKTRQR